MGKLNKIKMMLQSMLMEFNQVTTDKGILRYEGEEIQVNTTVRLIDEDGNESMPEDGKYYLGEEDGRTLVIENGTITEIIEREEVVEEPVEAEEEPVEEAVVEDIVDEIKEVAEDVVEDANEEKTDDAAQRIQDLEALVEELKARIKELESEPAAEPATEEFKKINSYTKIGDAKLDRLAQKLLG